MKRALFISFVFLSLQLEAQNILPNGSFENINACPVQAGQMYHCPPWSKSSGSPDLFNECGENGYSVPLNELGFQNAHEGVGYTALATYSENWDGFDVREFLKCPLNYPLVENQEYYVEYYVSQADSFQFATHNLGVTFTDVDTGEFGELLCWPDCDVYVENTSANPLSSKTDWVKVSGTLTALGGERYIHLGNFRTDDDSEIEFVGGGTDPNTVWNQAAYYIDDVWLSHVDSAHYVSVNEQLSMSNYQLSVYPNPAAQYFTVKGNTPYKEMILYDVAGRAVLRGSPPRKEGSGEVNIAHLPEGIYILRLEYEDGTRVSERVVVQRP